MSGETKRGPVLVVDDDSTILALIDMVLSDEGLHCLGAANGEEAKRRIAEADPSLILLDIAMPLMDGREFCRWLRSNGHAQVPVVVMTAGHNAARTCEELGAQGYLAKPFELTDMQSCVRKWAKNP